jgi:DNA-binding IclR family transcriptional regulator
MPERPVPSNARRSARHAAPARPLPPAETRVPKRVREVPAVSRAVAILRLLGRSSEPMGVKAIAQSLDIVTSTCLHILRVLVAEELLQVDAAKRYRLGIGMLSLARSVIDRNQFPAAVQPVLDRLSLQWNVTAMGVEIGGLDHMVVLALSQSKIPFRLHVDVGSRFPSLISATGRLVAAHANAPASEIERRFRQLRWQASPSYTAWRKQVETARRNGYAVDRGQYISGVTVLAVPVLNARKEVTHTLVAAGLADQLTDARCAEIARDMRAEAERLGASLFPSG